MVILDALTLGALLCLGSLLCLATLLCLGSFGRPRHEPEWKSMKGGGIDAGTIIDIVIIIGILVCIVVFGPILYRTLNDLGHVLDVGTNLTGAGLTAAGSLVEGSGYCLGNKIPNQVCDKNTLDTAEIRKLT